MNPEAVPEHTPSLSNEAGSDSNRDHSESYIGQHRPLPFSHSSNEWHPNEWQLSNAARHVGSATGESSVILDGGLSDQLLERPRNVTQHPDDFIAIGSQHEGKFTSPNLEQRIRRSMISNQRDHDRSRFLPIDALERILSRRNIINELIDNGFQNDFGSVAEEIWVTKSLERGKTSRKRIFAILCMIGQVSQITSFIKEGIYDLDLPFIFGSESKSEVYYEQGKNENKTKVFVDLFADNSWRPSERESFERYQGELLAPFFNFSYGPDQNVREYRLKDPVNLPFEEDILQIDPDLDLSLVRQGGCSIVRKVQIHPAHYSVDQEAKNQRPSYFAVKELYVGEGKETNREARALRRLNDTRDKHLIRLLAMYIHRGRVHMIFPWADGNLVNFWKDNPIPPSETPEILKRAKWMCAQILGLAHGLQRIHCCEVPKSTEERYSPQDLQRSYGRHGDLKPHNILWFKQDESIGDEDATDILKVADFGFADFHSGHSKSNVRRSKVDGFTTTYEAPELVVANRVSPQYDIWSFGCIILEFVVWYLRGWRGVDNFSKQRTNDQKDTLIPADNFFKYGWGKGKRLAASVKESVAKEFDQLKSHESCSDFVLDLLEYVHQYMLRVDPRLRAGIEDIVKELLDLNRRCHEDIKYCTERVKLQRIATNLSEIYEKPESPDIERGNSDDSSTATSKVPNTIRSTTGEAVGTNDFGNIQADTKGTFAPNSSDVSQAQRLGQGPPIPRVSPSDEPATRSSISTSVVNSEKVANRDQDNIQPLLAGKEEGPRHEEGHLKGQGQVNELPIRQIPPHKDEESTDPVQIPPPAALDLTSNQDGNGHIKANPEMRPSGKKGAKRQRFRQWVLKVMDHCIPPENG